MNKNVETYDHSIESKPQHGSLASRRMHVNKEVLGILIAGKEKTMDNLHDIRSRSTGELKIPLADTKYYFQNPHLERVCNRLKRELDRQMRKILVFIHELEIKDLKPLLQKIRELRNIERILMREIDAKVDKYVEYMEILYGVFRGNEWGTANNYKKERYLFEVELVPPKIYKPNIPDGIDDLDSPEYPLYQAKKSFQDFTRRVLGVMEGRIKETSRQIDEEVLPGVFGKDFPNLLQDMSKKGLSGIDGEKSGIAHKIAHEKVAQMIENMDILTVELKKYIEEELASFEKHIQMKFLAVPTNHYSNQTWRKRSNKDDKTYFEVGEFFK